MDSSLNELFLAELKAKRPTMDPRLRGYAHDLQDAAQALHDAVVRAESALGYSRQAVTGMQQLKGEAVPPELRKWIQKILAGLKEAEKVFSATADDSAQFFANSRELLQVIEKRTVEDRASLLRGRSAKSDDLADEEPSGLVEKTGTRLIVGRKSIDHLEDTLIFDGKATLVQLDGALRDIRQIKDRVRRAANRRGPDLARELEVLYRWVGGFRHFNDRAVDGQLDKLSTELQAIMNEPDRFEGLVDRTLLPIVLSVESDLVRLYRAPS